MKQQPLVMRLWRGKNNFFLQIKYHFFTRRIKFPHHHIDLIHTTDFWFTTMFILQAKAKSGHIPATCESIKCDSVTIDIRQRCWAREWEPKQHKRENHRILTLSQATLHEPSTSEQHVKISAKERNNKKKQKFKKSSITHAATCKQDQTENIGQVGVIDALDAVWTRKRLNAVIRES